MSTNKKAILFHLLLWGSLITVYLSGLLVDVTRDAAKYAYIAREMMETNNWIDIRILGEAYEQKPHFMFWLSAISFKIFGVSNFAYKLPVLLYSLLGIYFTYRLGTALYDKKTGKTAALIALFSILFVLYNQDLHTDTPLFTTTAFALWHLFLHLKTKRYIYLLSSSMALGIALLTKGPFGVILPAFATLAYLVFLKKWNELFNIKWILLILVAFVFALPVLNQLYNNWGTDGIKFFFFENTYGRFTGKYLGHTPDPFYYIHNMAYMLLPWTLAFFAAIYSYSKSIFRRKYNPADVFLYGGFVLFFILISASVSKLPNYLMCVLPVIAVISANFWHKEALNSASFVKWQSRLNYALPIFAIVVILYLAKGYNKLFAMYPVIMLLVYELSFRNENKTQKLFKHTLLSLTIAAFSLNMVVIPLLFGFQAQPQAARVLNSKPDIVVYNYPKSDLKNLKRLQHYYKKPADHQYNQTPEPMHFSYNYELMFYCNNMINHIETSYQLDEAANTQRAYIFTDEEGLAEIMKMGHYPDTVYTFDHFSLKRTAKYLFPKKGESPFTKNHVVVFNK